MQTKARTIKVRPDAYRKLKILAAQQGVTMLDLLDQIVEQELRKNEPINIADGQAKKDA